MTASLSIIPSRVSEPLGPELAVIV